jgi:hypothetical protein
MVLRQQKTGREENVLSSRPVGNPGGLSDQLLQLYNECMFYVNAARIGDWVRFLLAVGK